jgi:hypothetical protein
MGNTKRTCDEAVESLTLKSLFEAKDANEVEANNEVLAWSLRIPARGVPSIDFIRCWRKRGLSVFPEFSHGQDGAW